MIPLTNHDSSEGEQWGRYFIYPEWWYCRDNGILMDVPSGNLLHGYDSYGKLPTMWGPQDS